MQQKRTFSFDSKHHDIVIGPGRKAVRSLIKPNTRFNKMPSTKLEHATIHMIDGQRPVNYLRASEDFAEERPKLPGYDSMRTNMTATNTQLISKYIA